MTRGNSSWKLADQDAARPDFLELLYRTSVVNQFPVAIWSLPNSPKLHAMVDLAGGSSIANVALQELPVGFIFAPFNVGNKQPGWLIRSDVYCDDTHCFFSSEYRNTNGAPLIANKERFEATLQRLLKGSPINHATAQRNPNNWFVGNSRQQPGHEREATFRQWVELAIQKIRTTSLKKVVLSRLVEIELRKDFEPIGLFRKLSNRYENAFVSVVALPGVGTWIGATPELLLRAEKSVLTTVALAGTQSVASDATWHEKEVVEQAMVSDHVRECFLKQDIREFEERGPETMQIGNLRHLRTEFSLRLNSSNLPSFASAFLRHLHPTPAVCGIPNAQALDVIQELETHDREFYSGYLGPVNLNEQSNLFVNLRCLRLLRQSAILYAGSGITADSVPEQESVETDLKIEALRSSLVDDANLNAADNSQSRSQTFAGKVVTDGPI